jgi:quinol monooxygenase YgiN
MAWREDVAMEVRRIAERVAREEGMITYSDLTQQVRTEPQPEPGSQEFFEILDELSRRTDAEGKGMLSAVVVQKNEQTLPGPGFFKLAKKLGRDTSDQPIFHATELRRVHEAFPS